MAIKSNLEKHTINWLKRQDADGKLNKNISIQRKEVWDSEKKSNLIISLLLDIPIESLLFEEAEGESFNILDGKQRTLTLCAFVENGFALSPKIRIKELNGVALVGQTFQNLPQSMQEQIMEYELSISILRPLDEEERATAFFMRNQAVSLSKMDLSLVMLGQRAMDIFADLCNHSFMMNKIKLTAPARRKHDDLSVLLQYLILRTKPEMGFSGAEIMSFCDDIKNGEVSVPTEEMLALLIYLDEAITVKKAYLKKAHIPIVLYVAQNAMDAGVGHEQFENWLDNFFETLDADGEYMLTCKSGSSKRGNVQARVRIMSSSFDAVKAIGFESLNENTRDKKSQKKNQ